MNERSTVSNAEAEVTANRSLRRNYYLGLLNGMFANLGNRILSPQLVLTAFVYDLTGSNFLAGLLNSLSMAGQRFPQIYMSSLIEHRENRKRFYVAASVVRIVLLALMAGTIFLTGAGFGVWAMVAFFVVYFAFRSAQGCASIPFWDVLAGTVGPTRVGGFLGQRHFLGNAVTMLVAPLVVQPVLSAVEAPTNYLILTLIALGVMGLGWTAFCFVHEVRTAEPPRRRGVRESLSAGWKRVRREPNYRGLLVLRVLAHVNGLTFAFYIPYGVERLGVAGISGIFLSFISGARLVSSLVWGSVSNRKGNRLCLLFAAALFALNPVAALAAPHLPHVFDWAMPFTEVRLDLPLLAYLVSLCCFGFAQQANIIGTTGFVLETAPRGRRPSYMAFLNTVTFPMTFMPLLAGGLIAVGTFGLDSVFWIAGVSGVLTFVSTFLLTEVREGV